MTTEHKKPLPTPSPETKRYWEGCKSHELWLPYCRVCEKPYFYPRDFCPACFGWDIEWRKMSGRGTIHTFGVHYRNWHPAWADEVPYVTALVQLDEGPRIYTNIVGFEGDPRSLQCDAAVEVVFDDVSGDISLPKFRPVAG